MNSKNAFGKELTNMNNIQFLHFNFMFNIYFSELLLCVIFCWISVMKAAPSIIAPPVGADLTTPATSVAIGFPITLTLRASTRPQLTSTACNSIGNAVLVDTIQSFRKSEGENKILFRFEFNYNSSESGYQFSAKLYTMAFTKGCAPDDITVDTTLDGMYSRLSTALETELKRRIPAAKTTYQNSELTHRLAPGSELPVDEVEVVVGPYILTGATCILSDTNRRSLRGAERKWYSGELTPSTTSA